MLQDFFLDDPEDITALMLAELDLRLRRWVHTDDDPDTGIPPNDDYRLDPDPTEDW